MLKFHLGGSSLEFSVGSSRRWCWMKARVTLSTCSSAAVLSRSQKVKSAGEMDHLETSPVLFSVWKCALPFPLDWWSRSTVLSMGPAQCCHRAACVQAAAHTSRPLLASSVLWWKGYMVASWGENRAGNSFLFDSHPLIHSHQPHLSVRSMRDGGYLVPASSRTAGELSSAPHCL